MSRVTLVHVGMGTVGGEAIEQVIANRDRWWEAHGLDVRTGAVIGLGGALVTPEGDGLSDELWQRLGRQMSLARHSWPLYDPAKLIEQTMELPVQVNGKTRGTITVAKTATQDAAMAAAMAEANVAKFVTGPVKRVVFVPGRMLNILV